MCGILGCISNNIDRVEFELNLSKLNHRGPDDSGVYFDDNIALGQTRLSIVDLSKNGHQPMISSCGNFIIVFNGEIYNFEEIKRDLIQKKYKFHSNTDTEVILNGYIEYKEKIADKLSGMFAFSIYNKREKELFFARDRSGIKPLYYLIDNQNFLFASELKAIKKHSPAINFDAKILFLLLGYVPEPFTIYENISMFPAGYYGYYRNGKLKKSKYDKYEYEPKIIKPYSEILSNTRELLQNSIKRHLVSDAPIGVFLSGGVDSSAITAIAAKYKNDLHTLSLVFNEGDLSEERYQNLIVDKYSKKHTKYLIDEKSFLSSIDVFFDLMEQPTIDGLNTYFISKAAKESNLKSVLSGVGSDELFYGYPSFRNRKTLKFLSNLPYSLIQILENFGKYKKLELLRAEKELAYYLPNRALFSPNEISEILKIDISRVYSLITDLYNTYHFSNISELEDQMSFYELNMYMKNQLLRDADVFGMVNSLEIRVPFLDKELTNYLLKVAPKEKFGKYNKILLIDAVRNIVPEDIINRKKVGFELPFESWFERNMDIFKINNAITIRYRKQRYKFFALQILGNFK